ncbi:MAG: YoaK family protein [Solirubrobacteraceae bacterium]|jgi:uncharacterized membrane protein YoaK (UPF0700 family)
MSAQPASGAAPRTVAQQAAASMRHPLTLALLALTFSTGTVDAVSYLRLDHVFTANMTGSIALLGFGIAGAGGLPVLAPLIALAAFVVGAGAGGLLAHELADRQQRHLACALTAEGTMLAVAAILAAVANPRVGSAVAYSMIVLMAGAMGVRNATVRRIGVPDLTTTVLTLTITGLAADSRLARGSGGGTIRRLAAVSTMLVGALSGALMLRVGVTLPLAFAAGLALVTCLAYSSFGPRAGAPGA